MINIIDEINDERTEGVHQSKIRILDTETTGFKGGIVEIASVDVDLKGNMVSEVQEDLVKPEETISPGAMATHHITPEMVKDCPPLSSVINKYKMDNGIFIAHQVEFDLRMLPEGTIGPDVKILCTLKLAKELFDKYKFGNHKLGTLWYGYGLYKPSLSYKGVPHRAGYDCYMTAKVLQSILNEYNLNIEDAIELTKPKPIYETKCFMKKYKDSGLTWKQVKETDPGYCVWLVGNFKFGKDGAEIKKYLEEEESI